MSEVEVELESKAVTRRGDRRAGDAGDDRRMMQATEVDPPLDGNMMGPTKKAGLPAPRILRP
jgi:hypothetical protein